MTYNGPEFIKKELNRNLKNENIDSCSTPIYSPQSNGMIELFNGTFNRDYVYQSCLDSVLIQPKHLGDPKDLLQKYPL